MDIIITILLSIAFYTILMVGALSFYFHRRIKKMNKEINNYFDDTI